MAAEAPRYVVWAGLEVTDEALYARYRARMTPVLERYGGRFDHDFAVSRVLATSGSARINRVFALSFPDGAAHARFFADPAYLRVRATCFDPAVASRDTLGVFDPASRT